MSQTVEDEEETRDVGIPQYIVHAFTEHRYGGNPAAVCLCEEFPDDADMQRIAAENRLSETAFAVPSDEEGVWALRWFTPESEMPLCGHATLATAFVLFHEVEVEQSVLTFLSQSGSLKAHFVDGQVRLDFPAQRGTACVVPAAIRDAIGVPIVEAQVFQERYLLRVEDEAAVHAVQPDFAALAKTTNHGVIVTGHGTTEDFVSRFFAPYVGIPEDPVTGSAHCMLVPFWAERLEKTTFEAYQASKRGGHLFCALEGERVHLTGSAVLHARAELLP